MLCMKVTSTKFLSILKLIESRIITYLLLDTLKLSLVFVAFKGAHGVDFINWSPKEWQIEEFRRKMMGPVLPLTQQPLDAVWQPVAHTRDQFFVYSAFVERRPHQPAAVRLIGATSTRQVDQVFCRLWLRDSRIPHILQATIKIVEENHGTYYSAVFVLCLLEDWNPEDTINGSIALVSQAAPEKLTTNLLRIVDTTPTNRVKPNLHVCVRPLFGSINNVDWMVEWIEMNRILGVSHFYFYNMSIGERFDCMLRRYQNQEKLFTILPFPFIVQDIWAEGQLVSMHDCLYRSMARADWLLMIDIDELVLPHLLALRVLQHNPDFHTEPLLALFDRLIKDSEKENIFAFVFRNAFFYLDFKDDPESPVPLQTSRKTKRLQLLNWFAVRSKYALRPSKIVDLYIHDIKEFEHHNDGRDKVNLGSHIAMLHHYRNECIDIDIMCTENDPSIIDRTAHVWADKLWKRVQKRLADINQNCPLPSNSSSSKFT